jgi:hypothetical protein
MKRYLLILFLPTVLLADIDRVNEDVTLPYWPDYILSGDPNELDEYFKILIKALQDIQDKIVTAVNLGVDLDDTDIRYFGTKDTSGNYSNGDWRLIKVSADDFELQKLISGTWTRQMKWSVASGTEITGNFTSGATIRGSTLTDGTFTTTAGAVAATTLTLTPITAGSIIFAGTSGLLSQDNANLFWNDTTNILTLGGALNMTAISDPGIPATDSVNIFIEDVHGYSFMKYRDDTGMIRHLIRDSMLIVYNDSGSSIAANRVVYASGNYVDVPTVALAKSNAIATMPAIGVTIEAIANNAYGRVMQVGLLESINTSALTAGDILYVHDTVAGLVRVTPPTTPALTQEIGTVLTSSATIGSIQIIARGLTGDEYGTAQNDFYIGDGAAGTKNLHFNAVTDMTIGWDETELELASDVDVTGQLKLSTTAPPATASAAGEAGDIQWGSDYVYVCVAANTWKRAALTTWGIPAEQVIYAAENVVYAAESVVYP